MPGTGHRVSWIAWDGGSFGQGVFGHSEMQGQTSSNKAIGGTAWGLDSNAGTLQRTEGLWHSSWCSPGPSRVI